MCTSCILSSFFFPSLVDFLLPLLRPGLRCLGSYEEEGDIFFEDLSNELIQDDTLARLLTFPNVLVTGHQAFFTSNALEQIAKTTLSNGTDFTQGKTKPGNEVKAEVHLSVSAKNAAGRKDSSKNKL